MRVLLVEDDNLLGEAVDEQITRDGHSTDHVTTLRDARRYVEATISSCWTCCCQTAKG